MNRCSAKNWPPIKVNIVRTKKEPVSIWSADTGGPDPGAIGRIGKIELHEDEYAYDIVLRLARNLMTKGPKSIIIQRFKDKDTGMKNKYLKNSKRETCMGSPIPFNQVRRLKQRSDKIKHPVQADKYASKQNYLRA